MVVIAVYTCAEILLIKACTVPKIITKMAL